MFRHLVNRIFALEKEVPLQVLYDTAVVTEYQLLILPNIISSGKVYVKDGKNSIYKAFITRLSKLRKMKESHPDEYKYVSGVLISNLKSCC